MVDEKTKVEKKSKEQVEAEVKAEAARKKALRESRKARRSARLAILKSSGYRPTNRLDKDKRTGKNLKGFFRDGTAEVNPSFGADS